jgi:hypothetical protein
VKRILIFSLLWEVWKVWSQTERRDKRSLFIKVVYMTNKMRQFTIFYCYKCSVLYMFRAIIAHHQELGTVCAAVRFISCEVPSSVVYIPIMVLRCWYSAVCSGARFWSSGEAVLVALGVWWSFLPAGACVWWYLQVRWIRHCVVLLMVSGWV